VRLRGLVRRLVYNPTTTTEAEARTAITDLVFGEIEPWPDQDCPPNHVYVLDPEHIWIEPMPSGWLDW
jgi:hypothetical protein